MHACEVLEKLQIDLEQLTKSRTVPVEQKYLITPGLNIEFTIKKLEPSEEFEVRLESSTDKHVSNHANYKKASGILVGLTLRSLLSFLADSHFGPCDTMRHRGADEILTLYKAIEEFKENPTIPYLKTVKSPAGEYNILYIEEKGTRYAVEIETNCIYGNSVKSIVEVESVDACVTRLYKLLESITGEWLRPESMNSMAISLQQLSDSRR